MYGDFMLYFRESNHFVFGLDAMYVCMYVLAKWNARIPTLICKNKEIAIFEIANSGRAMFNCFVKYALKTKFSLNVQIIFCSYHISSANDVKKNFVYYSLHPMRTN